MEAQVTDNWIGRTLGGRYRIIDVIGEGGMGVVYRANQLSIDREIAIKMMHARASQDPKWSDRFQSEAKACSLLTHPNTIRLYDFGKTTLGSFYMVMELLEGRSLTDAIAAEAPMDAGRVLRILMQCCASLSEAHKAGIIHRDIKPDNIIVQSLEGASDFIKLIDFSIAKRSDLQVTAAGLVMGTPQFMSPEQARGEEIDLRSDLYSLGVVAYFMLTGTLPFHDQDALEVLRMQQVLEVPPMPDHVPSSVSSLILSCLEKDRSRRPASALSLLEACKIWLTELDPTLDVASDPILKNTLISSEPAMPAATSLSRNTLGGSAARRSEAPTSAKTMLGVSGSFSQNWDKRAPTAATAEPVALSPKATAATVEPVTLSPKANAATVAQTSAATSPGLSSPGPVTAASAASGQSIGPSLQSSGTKTPPQSGSRSSEGESIDHKQTTVRSPSEGTQPSEGLVEPGQRSPRATAKPTVNEFSSSRRQPGTLRVAQAPQSDEYRAQPAENAEYQAQTNNSAANLWSPPSPSRAGFFFTCLLVAVTFGFGAYFFTSTLR